MDPRLSLEEPHGRAEWDSRNVLPFEYFVYLHWGRNLSFWVKAHQCCTSVLGNQKRME